MKWFYDKIKPQRIIQWHEKCILQIGDVMYDKGSMFDFEDCKLLLAQKLALFNMQIEDKNLETRDILCYQNSLA